MWVLLGLSVILCIRLSWHFVFRCYSLDSFDIKNRLNILNFRLHTNHLMQNFWNIMCDVRCYIYWVTVRSLELQIKGRSWWAYETLPKM